MIQQIEPQFGVEEATAIQEYILSGGWGTEHVFTRKFEEELAKFLGVRYCSVTTSGTTALILALMAVGIQAGDEVICPSLTMMATPNSVRMLGAKPVFVDVNKFGVLDVEKAIDAITPKTKAIIYVSLNGRASDLHGLLDKCVDLGIPLVEDACQSLGSRHNGQYLGTIGDIGCFSLSPHKIISTGQGGFVVSNDEKLITRFRKLRDFGRLKGGSDIHPEFGINGKFTDFQSIIGLEQLRKLPRRLEEKRRVFSTYVLHLSKFFNFIKNDNEVVPWFVDIYLPKPEDLKRFLDERKIGSRRMYPPCHRQYCYKDDSVLPFTSVLSQMGLWLPSSPTLKNDTIGEICEVILRFVGK